MHLPIANGSAFLHIERSHGYRAFFDALDSQPASACEREAAEALEEICAQDSAVCGSTAAPLSGVSASPAEARRSGPDAPRHDEPV